MVVFEDFACSNMSDSIFIMLLLNKHCSLSFQISLNGLEIVTLMVNRMGENFRPYVHTGKERTIYYCTY